MTERWPSRAALLATAALLLLPVAGCEREAAPEATGPAEVGAPAGGTFTGAPGTEPAPEVTADTPAPVGTSTAPPELITVLVEVSDQLDAGDWGPYQTLRAKVSAGMYVGALGEVLTEYEGAAQRMAALVLEDLLVAPMAPAGLGPAAHQALRDQARPALLATVQDGDAGATRALAIRITGRYPRGATQAALLEALDATDDATAREMLLAALGDNADAAGAALLQGRFDALGTCGEARHAALALRSADGAVTSVDLRPWLADVAAPRVLACAVEAVETPDAALLTLAALFDQPPSETLVQHVLLGDVPEALGLAALRLILRSGDPAAVGALEAALDQLPGALAAEADAVLTTLKAD